MGKKQNGWIYEYNKLAKWKTRLKRKKERKNRKFKRKAKRNGRQKQKCYQTNNKILRMAKKNVMQKVFEGIMETHFLELKYIYI